jgi:pimeloyl-ACP methyl ester carboxylesterase
MGLFGLKLAALIAVTQASQSLGVTVWPNLQSRQLDFELPEYLKLDKLYGAPPNDFGCVGDKNPVVLLHGLSGNRNVHLNMFQKELNSLGYCTFSETYGAHTAVSWIGGVTAMRDAAVDIADFIRMVHRETGAEKVDIVGYSEGGVMSVYVPMTQEGIAPIVDHIVALGPAIHGAEYYGVTDFWYIGGDASRYLFKTILDVVGCPACDDMAPDGTVYYDFKNASRIVQTEHNKATIIVSNHDTLVPPEKSVIMEEGVRNVLIQDHCPDDPTNHGGLMWDRSAWSLALNALQEDYARPVTCDKGLPI